uniref:Putative secreted protein n=1 Tax=Anopheles marajoara TaxID=58244 RepID=A0A2M4CAU9_9DIPT
MSRRGSWLLLLLLLRIANYPADAAGRRCLNWWLDPMAIQMATNLSRLSRSSPGSHEYSSSSRAKTPAGPRTGWFVYRGSKYRVR